MTVTEAPRFLSSFLLADLPEGDQPKSWIQVMIVGDFDHGRYGKFSLSENDLAAYAADIQARGDEILIDFDHESAEGKTKAAGWYTGRTEIKPDAMGRTALFAEVEWTPAGATAIRNKEYRWISPEFSKSWRDAFGKLHKQARMWATALTNRAFLPDMAPVTLSERGQPYYADEEQLAAVTARYGEQVAALVREAVTGADGAAETARLILEQTPISQGGEMDNTQIIKALGLPEDADEEAVLAAVAEQKENADKVTALEEQVAELSKRPEVDDDTLKTLTAQAAQGAEAAKKLHDLERDTLLAKAVEEGKILPAQKDAYAAMYDVDAENVTKLLEATPARSFAPVGSGGEGPEGEEAQRIEAARKEHTQTLAGKTYEPDEDSLKLDVRAKAILAEQNISDPTEEQYLTALEQAEREQVAR